MSTSVRRRVVAWAGGGVLLAGGAAAATRWRARAQRRAELDRSYAQLTAQLCALHEDKLRRTHELQERQAAARRLRETVDTLWRDRLARYARVTDDLRAYVRALPEALGVLHGVTQHYAYMATEARRFVGFDVACAKLHSLALLLHAARRTSSGSDVVRSPRAAVSAATMAEATTRTAHAPHTRSDNNNNDKRSDKGNSDGNDTAAAATITAAVQDAHMCSFPQVLSTLRDFFASEPLVCAVCTALQPTASTTCATSVADSSATFAYCMQQLHDRVDAVVARCASSSSSNSNDTTQKDSSDTGLLYELAGRLVAALSFDLRPRVARRVQAQQSALQQQLLRERYALHTPADVYAAVVYAHVLLRQLHDSNNNDDGNTTAAAAAAATAMAAAAVSCSSSEAATTTASDTSVQRVNAVDALLTQHTTHASDATSAATMLHAVRSDAAVQVALRDLAAWSRAAAVMLARAQALDALDCYHTLLSTTVIHE